MKAVPGKSAKAVSERARKRAASLKPSEDGTGSVSNPRKDLVLEHLLNKAAELFLQRGYANTRMQDIAELHADEPLLAVLLLREQGAGAQGPHRGRCAGRHRYARIPFGKRIHHMGRQAARLDRGKHPGEACWRRALSPR